MTREPLGEALRLRGAATGGSTGCGDEIVAVRDAEVGRDAEREGEACPAEAGPDVAGDTINRPAGELVRREQGHGDTVDDRSGSIMGACTRALPTATGSTGCWC